MGRRELGGSAWKAPTAKGIRSPDGPQGRGYNHLRFAIDSGNAADSRLHDNQHQLSELHLRFIRFEVNRR